MYDVDRYGDRDRNRDLDSNYHGDLHDNRSDYYNRDRQISDSRFGKGRSSFRSNSFRIDANQRFKSSDMRKIDKINR